MSRNCTRNARRGRKLLIVTTLILTCGAASAGEPLLRVFAIRGFAGVVFSRGLNQFCEELAHVAQVACTVEDFYDASGIEDRASAAMAAGQGLVFVGHSLGAHAALRIAAAMKGSIPLVVTIDPNWFPTPPAVPENAKIVLNYYQDVDILGRAMLPEPSTAFRGKLFQFRSSEPHVGIERSPQIHAEIIAEIRDVLISVNPPSPKAWLPRPDADKRSR